MPELTVTLNKAQKFLEKLKAALRKHNTQHSGWDEQGHQFTNDVTVKYYHLDYAQFKASVEESRNKAKQQHTDYIALLYDVTTTKEALFKGNVLSGLSHVLNRIDIMKKQKTMWETLQKNSNAESVVEFSAQTERFYTTNVLKYKEGLCTGFSLSHVLYTDKEIEQQLQQLSATINTLEDEKDRLNHSHKITLDLSHMALGLLGVHV